MASALAKNGVWFSLHLENVGVKRHPMTAGPVVDVKALLTQSRVEGTVGGHLICRVSGSGDEQG